MKTHAAPLPLLLLLLATPAFADERPPAPVAVPAAPQPAAARSIVVHLPPMVSEPDIPIELEAMLDAPFAETLAVVWRPSGHAKWEEVAFERSSAGGWFATLPGTKGPGVEYFIRGRDAAGIEVAHFASETAPHVVRVDPSLVDRLETLEAGRLANHRDQVAFDIIAHNFGNRFGLADRFVRAELGYTHRLLRVLHSISFGFGSISGKTPLESIDNGEALARSLRYGYGEIRLRPHPSVFLDARASLGVSHDGFDQGIRGQITFGRPWRSNLAVGGEFLGDLGGSGWVRLQWDTAPPFLMGASIMRTDLPGAEIDSAGLYLGYDIAYPIANRVTLKAQVSYGSRDGASHFGGGFGSAVDF